VLLFIAQTQWGRTTVTPLCEAILTHWRLKTINLNAKHALHDRSTHLCWKAKNLLYDFNHISYITHPKYELLKTRAAWLSWWAGMGYNFWFTAKHFHTFRQNVFQQLVFFAIVAIYLQPIYLCSQNPSDSESAWQEPPYAHRDMS